MERREFLRQCLLVSGGLLAPIVISAELVLVDYKLLDGWEKAIKVESINRKGIATVSFNTKMVWQHIRVIDNENREWSTEDEGQTWRCGLMEFSLEDSE